VAALSAAPLFKNNPDSITALGGSLLTAAELESAKHYIELADETTAIAYAVCVPSPSLSSLPPSPASSPASSAEHWRGCGQL
jgi:hypothetical protein